MSDTEQNVRSRAALAWHTLTAQKMSDHDIVEVWNEYVRLGAVEEMKANGTAASKSRVSNNFKAYRRAFWEANEDRLLQIAEVTDAGLLQLKEKAPSKARPIMGKPPVKAIRTEPSVDVKGLSETEKAILLGGRPMTPAVVTEITTVVETAAIPESERDAMLRAIEEADAEAKKLEDYLVWAGRLADAEAEAMRSRKGEGLWANAVTVEAFPADPTMRVVLVRSSTAPMMGTHGPTVKHDFRANGVPVNHKHTLMVRQNNGEKLIRSRIVQPKKHEFYAKGLKYQEGMYFKGYFEVDGTDQPALTRYYVCRANQVVTITEAEYRDLENQAAARPRN